MSRARRRQQQPLQKPNMLIDAIINVRVSNVSYEQRERAGTGEFGVWRSGFGPASKLKNPQESFLENPSVPTLSLWLLVVL